MISIYKPYLPEKSLKYAHDALDSTWISSQGKYIDLATDKLKEMLEVNYVLLTNNGTSACHLVAKAFDNFYPTKQHIFVPNNVYVACWNTLLYDNKDRSFFLLPANGLTWNADYFEECNNAEAVLVVHNLGNIVDIPELKRKFPRLVILEDNCEGLFGRHSDGSYSGTRSFCSSFSFFANKTLTAGEGGAFVTNDKTIYNFARKTHGQGMTDERYVHDVLGYNYRMTNVQAAILYGQLEIKNEILERKAEIFDYYKKNLSGLETIALQKEEENTTRANWLFAVKFLKEKRYKESKEFFDKEGIEVRPLFYPMGRHKHLRNRTLFGAVTKGTMLSEQVVMFPSYPELTRKEQDYIIDKIKEYGEL